ncbi:MAG: sulfotransferase [Cyanobacteria bacterium P01_F01_bin.33]
MKWLFMNEDKNRSKDIKDTITEIESRWPDLKNNEIDDNPTFIFSAGWRSGSTLLQRLVMSDNQTMIWGESYKHCNIIKNFSNSLKAINKDYPEERWFLSEIEKHGSVQLEDLFIANLYPEVKYFKKAHQNFLLDLLAEPARERNYPRWGLKEVRLNVDDAIYLKWLFPKAKFLFLYRNPYKAYISLRAHFLSRAWTLYEMWPTMSIRTPHGYGSFWARIVEDYINRAHEVDGLIVKYEDLCSGQFPIEKLEEYLDINISKKVLIAKIGQTENKEGMTRSELLVLQKALNPLAEKLGYQPIR